MTDVPHETVARLEQLRRLVLAENKRQNLIAASTEAAFDVRHVEDSRQLLDHIGAGPILDIGSGGGFPGLVIAICRRQSVHLVEPRKRRAAFLHDAAQALGLAHVEVHGCRVEEVVVPPVASVTARAVAPLTDLFAMAAHLADARTRWVLPKGRRVRDELEVARRSWQGEFMLHPSRTDPEAQIVIATAVRRIGR